ncbi:MAG: hypothetical protein ABIJ74_01110 [archaeon]
MSSTVARTYTTVSRKELEILLFLREPRTHKEVEVHREKSKGTVGNQLKSLINKGFVRKELKSSITLYELTDEGKEVCSNFLEWGDSNALKKGLFRAHSLRYVSNILEKPDSLELMLPSQGFTSFNPKNRVDFKKEINGIMVIISFRTVQFNVPSIYCSSALIANERALAICNSIKELLEKQFPGLSLSDSKPFAISVSPHIALIDHPILKKFQIVKKETGISFYYKGREIIIDFSKGQPEIESYGLEKIDRLARLSDFFDEVAAGKVQKKFEELEKKVYNNTERDRSNDCEN